jgi:hypothetical protein
MITNLKGEAHMKWYFTRNLLVLALAVMVIGFANSVFARSGEGDNKDRDDQSTVRGRIIAVGIPGASAVAPVGDFLPGGPIHDKPALAAFTQPGKILDHVRILVGSNSNFGEPMARTDQRPGSFLSIDPNGPTLVIPADFASAGGQASTLDGRVQVFTANNAAFLNSISNPAAATANFTGASNPLGIAINNAFGRLWPANAPTGLEGIGTSTILDPQGFGLAGAPNPAFGGVYADNLANRGVVPPSAAQVIPGGLNSGAVATVFFGASPDGSKRAVFAVVEADGSIVQEHTGQGLDGLAPPGTISPLFGRGHDRENDDAHDENSHLGITPRVGAILNWAPSMILYVSEPFRNRIAALDITPDPKSPAAVFRVTGLRHFRSEALDEPIDLTPVVIETDDTNFSGNTTLNEGSDFYVANRGNNTIVRMRQDGTVVAVRKVQLEDGSPLGEDAHINGIATSPSPLEENAANTVIWITVTGHLRGVPDSTGAVLALPAF